MKINDIVIGSILSNEGFKAKPYKDSLGNWTIGHGITYLTEEESVAVVRIKVKRIAKALYKSDSGYNDLPYTIQDVIIEMGYQLGLKGLFKFKRMWKALEGFNYEEAAKEMLDSRWAEQTPNRAERLARIVRRYHINAG